MQDAVTRKWDNHWKRLTAPQRQASLLATTSLDSFSEDCYRVIKKHLPPQAKRVLEIGCGTGRFIICLAQDFPDLQIEGSDISEQSIAIAKAGVALRKLTNVTLYSNNLLKLAPLQSQYDYIFLEGVLHYLPKKCEKEILQRLSALLSPGGVLLIGVPNKRFYLHTLTNVLTYPLQFWHRCYERSYFGEQLAASFQQAGLNKIEYEGAAIKHGLRRSGFPWANLAQKGWSGFLPQWNKRYGFYLFVKGEK